MSEDIYSTRGNGPLTQEHLNNSYAAFWRDVPLGRLLEALRALTTEAGNPLTPESVSENTAVKVEMRGKPSTFEDFCREHRIKLVARERSVHDKLPRWYATSDGLVEIAEGGFLTSTFGHGNTPNEAVAAYAKALAGHDLCIGGMDGERIAAPNEWLPASGVVCRPTEGKPG